MKIRDLFTKPIDRAIKGVVVADDRAAEILWQELDEYVVTKQLTEYFRKFFDAYLAAADNPKDPVLTSRMGVWVSGFFGSGKSHFIKILAHLLENLEVVDPTTGKAKRASEFFDEHKIKDPLLLADVRRATQGSADVILFNIDAKADSKSDRDVILQVFLRVFNEKLGYAGDSPHIAEMERHLVSKGAYDTFQAEFHKLNGSTWRAERDAVDFLRDDVVKALSVALQMTPDSAAKWFDNARDSYKTNIESFAKLLRDYLDTQPKGHRIIFLVDEAGQFISDNTQLMLTLQTITEQLGTLCQGRAWVIVTSQEDIDAAIGDANKARSQDFSKIQGRFHTRLSLASSNTDDVISERLLAKTEAAHQALRDVFAHQGDIINNQLSFAGTSVTMRAYRDAAEFVACYPFAPYQFLLLQKIFESIRKVGATGKHLSRGERSLLDAFQSAACHSADRGIDALVPLQDFYPSIESFLDTSVKKAIDQAVDNPALEPQDVQLLKALFLIRYVAEVIKPTVDNLATLCLDQIDADKLALKRRIQESLERLEGQRLVSRNGDQWFFLTNEERDVAREIGHVDVSSAEKARLLSELVFDEILAGQTKVRHRETKGDYEFNRVLDGVPYKQATHALTLEVLTPLGDGYELSNESRCVMRSAEGAGCALVRMEEGTRLDVELTLYRQIEKYVDSPKASTASPSLKKILIERKDENRERRARLVEQLGTLMTGGDFYAKGQKLASKAASPTTLLDELINYLVTNTYIKLPLLKVRKVDANSEIRAVLAADDLAQRSLALGGEEGNPQAIQEVREYLHLTATQNRVLLSDVVDRFSGNTYGWKPEWEIVLIVARLFMAGEIKLTMEGSDLDPKSAVDPLTKAVRFKQVSILKRKVADAGSLKRARELHKELFSALAREDEDGLVADFRSKLGAWDADLRSFATVAAQKHYPGKAAIDTFTARIGKQLGIRDSFEFVEALNKGKDEWLTAGEDVVDISAFYKQQVGTWRKLLEALAVFDANREALVKDAQANAALNELEAIRDNTAPYAQVKRIEPLVATVQAVNERLAHDKREKALLSIEAKIQEATAALLKASAGPELRNKVLLPLQQLKTQVAGLSSIPQILYLQGQGGERLDDAMDAIAAAAPKPALQVAAPAGPLGTPAGGSPTVPLSTRDGPNTVPKPSQVVRAADLSPKTYLETEAEVEAYLASLKARLLSVLQAGQRIRMQ
jgi:hypothetical protein